MKTSEYKDRINEVINHIHDNLDTSLTIDVLSGIAFLSQSHFKKIFKAVSGENISDYVKRARLEKAQYMLLHNQHRSITDIALETGFSSSASFARAFGRYFGISASDFRRDNLNESIIHFGTPFLRNISPEEYKGCETVYAVADDGRGAYYFGSEFGEMYIFNNDKFEKIKFPELEDVLSLAFDEEDTLWIGSVGQFGYAERDDEGIFRFVSLADRLPEKERSFNQVWKIVVTPVGIYFQTPSAIFRWYDNVLTFVKTDTSYHSLTYVNEKLYLLEFREGLLSLDGMELKREPGADQMNEEHLAVYNFLPYDEEYIFCLSRNKGCYLYNGKNFIQFSTEVDHLFEEAGLLRSVYIPRVGYAIGTRTMGIIIINKEGKLVSSVNRKRGLLDNYIRALHCTRDGTLLMGMMYGIALLNVGLPVMIFSEDSGISTMIKSVRRYQGTLYLATHYGIALEKHNYRSGEEIFRRIPDIITQAHDLVESNDSLCVAYGFGLYFIRGKKARILTLMYQYGHYAFPLRRKIQSTPHPIIKFFAFTFFRDNGTRGKRLKDCPDVSVILWKMHGEGFSVMALTALYIAYHILSRKLPK